LEWEEGILTCSFCNGITTQEFFSQEESLFRVPFLVLLVWFSQFVDFSLFVESQDGSGVFSLGPLLDLFSQASFIFGTRSFPER
jgi:hypothetical protein